MIGALLPILAAVAAASPITQELVMKQSLKTVPNGWEFHSAAPSALKINMHIGLKEQNMDKLHQRLMQISNPSHADYGKHMSKADVEAMTAPSKATVDTVNAWLSSHGIQAGKVSNGFMALSVTTSQAEKLLGTKYSIYHNAEKDQYTVRTTEYSLPKDVHSEVVMVQPTTMFSDMGMLNKNLKTTVAAAKINDAAINARATCGNGVTPSCLKTLYNINYTPQSNQTAIGITGYLGEIASQDDLSSFLQQYTQIPSSAAFSVELVNGGSNSGSGTIEANLDTQ